MVGQAWSPVLAPLVALLLAVVSVWVVLVGALWVVKPDEVRLREALRLLPDVVRLVRRLAGDRSLPRSVRWRLWALLAYLASPIDLVPDVIPVLGWADDVILMAIVLRSVVRTAGPGALEHHWPGTSVGLGALRRLVRV